MYGVMHLNSTTAGEDWMQKVLIYVIKVTETNVTARTVISALGRYLGILFTLIFVDKNSSHIVREVTGLPGAYATRFA